MIIQLTLASDVFRSNNYTRNYIYTSNARYYYHPDNIWIRVRGISEATWISIISRSTLISMSQVKFPYLARKNMLKNYCTRVCKFSPSFRCFISSYSTICLFQVKRQDNGWKFVYNYRYEMVFFMNDVRPDDFMFNFVFSYQNVSVVDASLLFWSRSL